MNVDNRSLIAPSNENVQLIKTRDKCDKYDYLIAVACGAIGGVVDAFLVGAPNDSILGKWTDKQVDKAVMCFARRMGWNPRQKNAHNVKSAIGYLEHGKYNGKTEQFQGFKVNYDQRKPEDVGNQFTIAPNTHHMMSLGHSPDIIGLFFSILNQFTSTSSFISDGKLITIDTKTFQLQGGNLIAKLFCGVANWFGHLMSDIAGSSGSHGRGSGIVMPFYELFGLCKFGKFSTTDGVKDLSELAMQAFNQGYDFRFGIAQAIPVVITDLSIRLIWAIRQRFQYKLPLKECVPNRKHENLRVMLLVGNGTLCVVDAIDAGVRSGGNALIMFMRLNIVAWYRFTTLVLREVCIRLGLPPSIDDTIAAFKRVNEAIAAYLTELKKLDIALYKKETENYNRLLAGIDNVFDEASLNAFLLATFDEIKFDKPWDGDFDEFMSNRDNKLVFG